MADKAAWRSLWILNLVPFSMVLSNSMLIPVLPAIQEALHSSLFKTGLIITAFSIPAGLLIPIGGYLSDRIGRKRVMITGLAIFGLGGLIAALAPILFKQQAYGWIIGARILQGLGAGGTYQVAMALAGDLFHSKQRSKALGILEAFNGLGKVAAPIIGSAVALLIWYAPFFVYPVIAWLSAAAVAFFVVEPKHSGARQASIQSYFHNLKKVWAVKALPLAVCFLAGFVALFMLFGVLSIYSDILEKQHGIKGISKGLVIAVPVLLSAILSFLAGTLMQKKLAPYMKWVMVIGLILGVGGLALTGTLRGMIPLLSAVSLLGIGNGLLLPALNTLITGSVGTEERGFLTSLYGTVRFFGAALGPPAFSLAFGWGMLAMGLSAAAVTAVTALLTFFFINQRQMLKKVGPETPRHQSRIQRREKPAFQVEIPRLRRRNRI